MKNYPSILYEKLLFNGLQFWQTMAARVPVSAIDIDNQGSIYVAFDHYCSVQGLVGVKNLKNNKGSVFCFDTNENAKLFETKTKVAFGSISHVSLSSPKPTELTCQNVTKTKDLSELTRSVIVTPNEKYSFKETVCELLTKEISHADNQKNIGGNSKPPSPKSKLPEGYIGRTYECLTYRPDLNFNLPSLFNLPRPEIIEIQNLLSISLLSRTKNASKQLLRLAELELKDQSPSPATPGAVQPPNKKFRNGNNS